MTDGFKAPLGEPLIRIVVVEIGDAFAGLAAEFSNVVSRRCAGEQRQVYAPACGVIGPHNAHGDMMDSRDVFQCAERGHFTAKAHGLVNVFPPKAHQKLPVFLGSAAVGQFLFRTKGKVELRIEGERLPLRVKQHLQDVQVAKGRVPLLGGVLHVRLVIEQGNCHMIGIDHPALLGRGRQPVQKRQGHLQHLIAGQPLLKGQQNVQRSFPLLRYHQRGGVRPAHSQLAQKGLRLKSAQQGLGQRFNSVHDRSSVSRAKARVFGAVAAWGSRFTYNK